MATSFTTAASVVDFSRYPNLSGSRILVLLGLATFVYWLKVSDFKFLYGDYHVFLNRLPSDKPGTQPATEWMNMGYWKDTTVFPHACEALALKSILATRVKEGARVLDVGHGSGDSLLLYLSHPSVSRPSSLTGITNIEVQQKRSQERVDALLRSSTTEPKPSVDLHYGDAVFFGTPDQINHPLDPSSSTEYDVISVIDCAGHFNTREKFLRQAYRKLSPGGRIVLADLCFEFGSLSLLRKFFALFLSIGPTRNMITVKKFKSQWESIGYVDIEVEDITDHVVFGLCRFLKGQKGLKWQLYAMLFRSIEFFGGRYVIIAGSK